MSIAWTKLGERSVQGVTTALTESAPSGNTGDGVDLRGVDSILITVNAPSGQTFTGTGTLSMYRRSALLGLGTWPFVENGDLDMTGAAGRSSITFGPIAVNHKNGRMAPIPNAIGVSGGTALTITIEASYGAGGDNQ